VQAYVVPEINLISTQYKDNVTGADTWTPTIFQRSMWNSTANRWWSSAGSSSQHKVTNAEATLEILAWGLLVHAVLHLVKDVMLFDLLRVPEAVR
jgi:hypothetical protein